jgi:hypothetical protein
MPTTKKPAEPDATKDSISEKKRNYPEWTRKRMVVRVSILALVLVATIYIGKMIKSNTD